MSLSSVPLSRPPRSLVQLVQEALGRVPIVWLLALAVGAAACIPLVYLVVRAAAADGAAWSDALSGDTLRLLLNTIALAAAVTGASGLIALPCAWLTERTDLPGARWWRVITVAPLAVPSYVAGLAVIAALGPNGSLQRLLAPLGVDALPELYGFGGAFLVLTLFSYPYMLLVLRAGLRDLDPALEEASRSLGRSGWETFRRVTLPQLRVPLAAGALLVALYVVSDFGAVSMLRFDTFTRAIYVRFGTTFDRSSLAVLSLVLVALAALVLAVESSQRRRGERYHRLGAGAARTPRSAQLGRRRWTALGGLGALAAVALALPLGVLLHWLARGLSQGESFSGLGGAALRSVEASALAGGVAVAAALPIAIVVVRRPGWLAGLVDRASYVGYALPGVVVAFAMIFFSLRVAPGLYQTLVILVFTYAVLFLPQAVGALRAALIRVPPSLEEASRSLGRGPGGTLLSVTLPLIVPGLVSGFALVFLTTMKELPATLLLAPTGFDTLATRVWTDQEDVYLARAAAAGLLLVFCAAAPMALLFGRIRLLRG